jgi:ABC-type transporter Mla subunit MlaD
MSLLEWFDVSGRLKRIEERTERIEEIVISINRKARKIMALQQEFLDVLKRIDDATTAIGERIQKLLDQLAAGGLTSDEEAAVLAQAKAQAEKLEGIAADPNNPVPNP